ncbi:MAG: hypothetical protein IPK16_14335 [Anaerolineales bacterium]|nr:hypothetical protein [Anaerolineales bacterium]
MLNPLAIEDIAPALERPCDLQFDNGLGGFSADGSEYQIYLQPGARGNISTPAPWINVIANPAFGFLISERGGGYTWAGNSSENRLTPWHNDPVIDRPGEVIYLRDEETGEIWSPTPALPARNPYLVRHGAGYTTFEHNSHNLKHHLRLFADTDAPVKIVQLRLENCSPLRAASRLPTTPSGYWVWTAKRHSSTSCQNMMPRRRHCSRNAYSNEFGQCVAFLASSKPPHNLTTDRTEFLGRDASGVQLPAGLTRMGLSGRVAPGLDPCAALQVHIDLPAEGSEEVYFLLGQGANREATLSLVRQFLDPVAVDDAWRGVQELWDRILGAVTVTTPDPAMNLMLNRWLLYQTLACRIWGRAALYQSSGAYGFRDQLQDVLALLHADPGLAREQILRAAGQQFVAGDVLHWWHPPSGRGVRTRCSDDLLWLPYVTAHYVAVTGDAAILQERIPFLTGEPLRPEEEEHYGHYIATANSDTLYEHCKRALTRGMTSGPHQLPLIGTGDWNDGMNRVGVHGQGESIWLGWFLHAALTNFSALCDGCGEVSQGGTYRHWAETIRRALEANGWDGEWYRRAFYDDGAPLGSAQNRECQIDAIAQSWAVLSGAADPERGRLAMRAVVDRLVNWEDGLVLLFAPPFDKTARDPGYIKGYLPGIRENGGQYTHAAMWAIWAVASLGDGDLATSLFQLVNPIAHSDTAEKVARYKVEPYVVAADVYSMSPHAGSGGWTWYTGSSGWMHRLGLEAILGLRRHGESLHLDPCIPSHWPGYAISYRYGEAVYTIQVENPDGVNRGVRHVLLDGEPVAQGLIALTDDGQQHLVRVQLGNRLQIPSSENYSALRQ